MDNLNNVTEAKTAKPKLKPDFKHRLGVFDGDASTLNLTYAVSSLAQQADAVIVVLSGQFLGEETNSKLSDDVIYWTLESVRATVNDIYALVTAYHEVCTPK